MADKINSLSHAIRIGRMFRPQAKGMWVKEELTQVPIKLDPFEALSGNVVNETKIVTQQTTCTAAAAIEALIGAPPKNTSHAALLFSNRFGMSIMEASGLITEIIHMNDTEGLSSEEIADRLEARGY